MKDTLTNVILSIKPVYAHAILKGKKRVEFRKRIFKRSVDKIFIYSSSPDKELIGYFTIKKVHENTPQKIWESFNKVGGIKEADFFEYYKTTEKAYAIEIDTYLKFEKGIDPKDFFEKFCAPQSYIYLEGKKAINILKKSGI